MVRQPWLFANSRISSSDISRRTRNSAGWVTTYSELIESLSPILAARAGKSLCICFCYRLTVRSTPDTFFEGSGGGRFGLRFNLAPSA